MVSSATYKFERNDLSDIVEPLFVCCTVPT